MRSLIILEVEHDDTTDGITSFLHDPQILYAMNRHNLHWGDYDVRVDVPDCFVLDKPQTKTDLIDEILDEHLDGNPWRGEPGSAAYHGEPIYNRESYFR